ncbi:MAG: hypothetical protein QOF76_4854 [Solirubrobacteraceae bacterium]|nr:hypothetical protein [Solirubrobacteraceae bacterium]
MSDWYRRSGATPPFGDPSRLHGVAMEGSYWRFTNAATGEVTIVLRGDCRAADGERWDLVAIAAHPGGDVAWKITPPSAGPEGQALRVAVDGISVDATWDTAVPWPARRAFGGLGPAQSVPFLGQYWHPHVLSGTARGTVRIGDAVRSLDGARVYAERNWGSTFAGHWWWGQAALDDGCVAFAGGRLLGGAPTALVVAHDGAVQRFTPPFARMAVATAPGRWRITARTTQTHVEVEAEADPAAALVLPVPVPAERRVIMRSAQHLTGALRVTVRRGRRVWWRGETDLAGLERGVP